MVDIVQKKIKLQFFHLITYSHEMFVLQAKNFMQIFMAAKWREVSINPRFNPFRSSEKPMFEYMII